MATTFDSESEAQALASQLNAAAGRDVRYVAQRYRQQWAIARQSKRTYWGWDAFPSHSVPPTPARRNDVETVRQIVLLALGDGMEIVILTTLLETGNKNGYQREPFGCWRGASMYRRPQRALYSAHKLDHARVCAKLS